MGSVMPLTQFVVAVLRVGLEIIEESVWGETLSLLGLLG
jgi:hypothetical protein